MVSIVLIETGEILYQDEDFNKACEVAFAIRRSHEEMINIWVIDNRRL